MRFTVGSESRGERMGTSGRPYPREFRREAVRRARGRGTSVAAVAREIGVSTQTLRTWLRHAELEAELTLREERRSTSMR